MLSNELGQGRPLSAPDLHDARRIEYQNTG
jgi:hypothetical protein